MYIFTFECMEFEKKLPKTGPRKATKANRYTDTSNHSSGGEDEACRGHKYCLKHKGSTVK